MNKRLISGVYIINIMQMLCNCCWNTESVVLICSFSCSKWLSVSVKICLKKKNQILCSLCTKLIAQGLNSPKEYFKSFYIVTLP